MAETYSAVVDAYDANADYSTTGSVVKAKAFIVACRRMRRFAMSSAQNGANVQFSADALAGELSDAESWLSSNDTANQAFGTVTHVDFAGFRE